MSPKHKACLAFLGGSVVKNLPANTGDTGDVGSMESQSNMTECTHKACFIDE